MAKGQRIGARSAVVDAAVVLQIDLTQWIEVDTAALPIARREQFFKRKRAIQMYIDGAHDDLLHQETGLKRRNVYRLIATRCLQQDEDGTLWLAWRIAILSNQGIHTARAPEAQRMGHRTCACSVAPC
jgi:hypothetical protein